MKKILIFPLALTLMACPGSEDDSVTEVLTDDVDQTETPNGEIVPSNPQLNRYIITSEQNRLVSVDAADGSQTEIIEFSDPFSDVNSISFIENDVAYFTTDRQSITGVDIASKRQLWETPIINSSTAVRDLPATVCNEGICYATGENGGLIAVDQGTGEEIWRYSLRSDNEYRNYQYAAGTPVFKDNRIYVIAEGSESRDIPAIIHILDKKSGELLLTSELPNAEARTPLVVGNTILVPSKNLYALAVENLQEQWVFETGDAGIPYVSGNTVVLQSERSDDDTKSELYALELDTGEMIWKVDTGFDYPFHPVIAGDIVFGVRQDVAFVASDPNGRPFAVTISEGKEVWSNGEVSVDTSPVFANGRLFFLGSEPGESGLVCLNANTGDVLWIAEEGLGVLSVPPVVVAENGVFGPSE